MILFGADIERWRKFLLRLMRIREWHILVLANFCGPIFAPICDRRYIGRYWSIQAWGSTNERVMPIRFEYRGRLAGTYEKISFLAYVTTNWYETNPFLRSVSMQFLNILSCIPTMSSKDGKYSAHWCLDRVGFALLGTAYFLKHWFVSDNTIHNLTNWFSFTIFFFQQN